MAERLQTLSRGAWLRTMARWMKAWAESVLIEEPGPAASAAPHPRAPDSTPAVPAATAPLEEASLESLEARWLRDVQARSRIPVADWTREGAVAPRAPLPWEEVGPARSPLPPVAGRPMAGRPVAPPPVSEARLPARPLASAPGRFPARARPGGPGAPPEGPRDALAPEPSPAPPPGFGRAGLAGSEPGPVPSGAWGIAPELAAAFRAPPVTQAPPPSRPAPRPPAAPPRPDDGGSAHTAAPAPRAPWSELPVFADADFPRAPSPPLRVVPPQPREAPGAPVPERTLPSSGLPRFRLLFLDGDPVSPQEPRRGRGAVPPEDSGWEGAQSPLPWRRREPEPAPSPSSRNVIPTLEGEPRSTEGAPPAVSASPWPELPPAPTQDGAEALVELRQWERRRRLEREQRGD